MLTSLPVRAQTGMKHGALGSTGLGSQEVGAGSVDKLEDSVVESPRALTSSSRPLLQEPGNTWQGQEEEFCQPGLGACGHTCCCAHSWAPGYIFWLPHTHLLVCTRTSWTGLGLCLLPGNVLGSS